ncbi:MAG: endolytic transglycosylase MltG [Aquificota bacterium]|nr:endolytic transglycosylase MltG [Aquificota bacterium]
MKKRAFLITLPVVLIVSYFIYIFLPVYVEEETVEIAYGTPTVEIVNILKEEGIIRSRLSFLIIHAFRKEKLEAGEYEFDGYVTPFEVYEKISRGIHKIHRIVIPEGSDIYDIAEILHSKGICRKEDFIRYATSPEVPKRYGLNTLTMEGFLFPDTYFFSKNTHPLRVIEVMHKNFLDRTEDLREEVRRRGISLEKWVTIASMIEKETFWEEEKPLIAAVIYNRLKKRMKLQIDPTVIYALKRRGLWKGRLTREDMTIDDPYNTYLYFGLPPTPICNPGLSSLRAALYPAKVDYLYFVIDPKRRKHLFSRTYSEHLRNVNRLRRAR